MVNHFCQKNSTFWFEPYSFVQISTACGTNTYQIRRGKTFDVGISNSNIKYNIGKSIFAVNLPLKVLHVTTANGDIGSLKSMCTTCWCNLNKLYGPNFTQFWGFLTKQWIKGEHFWQSVDIILEDISVAETTVWC